MCVAKARLALLAVVIEFKGLLHHPHVLREIWRVISWDES